MDDPYLLSVLQVRWTKTSGLRWDDGQVRHPGAMIVM